jgi:hypothetical protein
MLTAIAVLVIKTASFVQRKFCNFDRVWNLKLLAYDAESFALSFAWVFTTLIALGFRSTGALLVSSNSVLYEFEDEESDDSSPTRGIGIVYLYSAIICIVVAVLQINETEADELLADELVTENIENDASLSPAAPEVAVTQNPLSMSPSSSFEMENATQQSTFQQQRASHSNSPMGAPGTSAPSHQSELSQYLEADALISYTLLWNEYLG